MKKTILVFLILTGCSTAIELHNSNFFSSKDHAKAYNLNISLNYPSNWRKTEGERPHILQNFIKDNDTVYVNDDKPSTLCSIFVIKDESLTKDSFKDFKEKDVKESLGQNANLVYSKNTKIDGEEAVMIVYNENRERAGLRAYSKAISYLFEYEKKLIAFSCGVTRLVGKSDIVDEAFSKEFPVFVGIAGSIVIHNKWSN